MSKKTLVLGATPHSHRYAHKATIALQKHHHEVVPVGIHEGEINGLKILLNKPAVTGIDTVTLYVGPKNQPEWYDYIVSLNPKRVIFNPGTENDELVRLLEENDIEALEACTLVMLAIGEY